MVFTECRILILLIINFVESVECVEWKIGSTFFCKLISKKQGQPFRLTLYHVMVYTLINIYEGNLWAQVNYVC